MRLSCSASSAVVFVRPTHPNPEQETEYYDDDLGIYKREVANGSRYSLPFHRLRAPGLELVQLHSWHSRRAHRFDLRCAGIRSLYRAAREHEVRQYEEEVAGLEIKSRRC
jgi:hypothetical protein